MFHTAQARATYESRIDRSGGPDACHPWRGPKGTIGNHGYALVAMGRGHGVRELAHRVSYELAHGPIPAGEHVDHECHNDTDCPGGRVCPHRLCQNGRHLKAKMPDSNRAASHRANERKTHCPKQHPYTEQNTRIHRNGSRSCLTCAAEREAARPPRPRSTNVL